MESVSLERKVFSMATETYDQYPFIRQKGSLFNKILASWLINNVVYAINQFNEGTLTYPRGIYNTRQLLWYEIDSKLSTRAGYIGLVEAHDQEVNPIVIALRDTATFKEWISNVDFPQTSIYIPELDIVAGVANGFWDMYIKHDSHVKISLRDQIHRHVSTLLKEAPNRQIYISSHSLGASITSFIMLDLALHFPNNDIINYAFASPRTGDPSYANAFQYIANNSTKRLFVHWAIQNTSDIVPNLPPAVIGNQRFEHINTYPYPRSHSTVSGLSFSWTLSSYNENHSLAAYHAGIWQNEPMSITVFGDKSRMEIKTLDRTYKVTYLKNDPLSLQLATATTLDGALFAISAKHPLSTSILSDLFLTIAANIPYLLFVITETANTEKEKISLRKEEIRKWLKKIGIDPLTTPIIEVPHRELYTPETLKAMDLHILNKITLTDRKPARYTKKFRTTIKAIILPIRKKKIDFYFQTGEAEGNITKTALNLTSKVVAKKDDPFLIVQNGAIIGLGIIKEFSKKLN